MELFCIKGCSTQWSRGLGQSVWFLHSPSKCAKVKYGSGWSEREDYSNQVIEKNAHSCANLILFRRHGLSINLVWRPLGLCNRRQCKKGIYLSYSTDRPFGSPPSTATTHVSIAVARLAVLAFLLPFVVFHTSVRCSFHVQYVFKLLLSSIVLCSCLYVAFFRAASRSTFVPWLSRYFLR